MFDTITVAASSNDKYKPIQVDVLNLDVTLYQPNTNGGTPDVVAVNSIDALDGLIKALRQARRELKKRLR